VSVADSSFRDPVGPGLRNNAARFNPAAARELLEFAVDLDAQDDRLRMDRNAETAAASTQRDANTRTARALYCPQYGDRWQMLVDSRTQYADGTGRNVTDESSWDGADPNCNGFGPFANAWILARDRRLAERPAGADLPAYVVAIRGTVFSSRPSVLEDVFADTIGASHLVQNSSGTATPMVFAQAPGAEIHAGFGYACLSLLFDRQFGLIRALQAIPEAQAAIILTGHSQGAAMATLLHAFLRYATRGKWLLGDKKLLLSSYEFAQPKPGNTLFASDFDRRNPSDGGSFTINNSLDPVPAVPLTRQSLDDLSKDLPAASWIDKFIDAIEVPAQFVRNWLSSALDRQIIDFMASDDLLLDPVSRISVRAKSCEFPAGSSRNYTLAGTPVSLLGAPAASYAGQDPTDPFCTTPHRDVPGTARARLIVAC